MPRPSASAISHILLGAPGRDRIFVSQTLLALTTYVFFALMQQAEVLFGLIEPTWSNRLTIIYLTGGLLFYGLVRSGASKRLGDDPALTVAHTGFAVLVADGSYAITGPARGGVLALMVLLMAFAMFTLTPAQARRLALFSFTTLVTVMLWKSRTEPSRYPLRVELIHAMWAVIVLGAMAVLAGRMGQIRQRLLTQKLELQRALAQIGELATRDELTGLYNRRHMNELMAAQQARQRDAAMQKMTLALLDIDLFKRINDSHGHRAGDQVLQLFAEAGRAALRSGDVLARWGGEEFLLMLPHTSPEQAEPIVERLRLQLAAVPFDGVAPQLRVTFSSGLSACGGDDSLEACIERADAAMYRAKTQGRNCTVLA